MFDEMTEKAIKAAAESEEQYPVPLDRAWSWLLYSRKENAKYQLEKHFKEGLDFSRTFRKSTGGRPSEEIWLTKNCFKELAMMAGTEKGKMVRGFFIQCEEKLHELAANGLDAYPDDLVVMKALELMKGRIEKLEAANNEMRPIVQAHEALTDTEGFTPVRNIAKVLGIGPNKFFDMLRKDGLLDRYNVAYQRYIEQGYFVVRDKHIQNGSFSKVQKQTFVTPKGESYLAKKYGGAA